MLFVDLDKIKIVKEYHFETAATTIDFDIDASLMAQSEGLVDTFQKLIHPCRQPILYEVYIRSEGQATDEEIDSFLSAVNVITMVFFANMTKDGGRKREHRLDVPPRLMPVKVGRLTLKKAINQQTVNDVFNLTIHYKDLIYCLCDEKDMKGEEDA